MVWQIILFGLLLVGGVLFGKTISKLVGSDVVSVAVVLVLDKQTSRAEVVNPSIQGISEVYGYYVLVLDKEVASFEVVLTVVVLFILDKADYLRAFETFSFHPIAHERRKDEEQGGLLEIT